MTMVLTVATPLYVVQVADRILTRLDNRQTFDSVANKTIIYQATDGLVTIGYSGIAYIKDTPTDEWIAGVLWGNEPPRGRDGVRPTKVIGRRPIDFDTGLASIKLQDAIKSIPASVMMGNPLFLTIAGWQESHGRVRPIVIEIERKSKTNTTTIDRSPRYLPPGEDCRFHNIGFQLPKATLRNYFAPFRGENGLRLSPVDAENTLAQIIRDVSKDEKTVGSHVLSVTIPRPDLGLPGCRFIESHPHHTLIMSDTADLTVPTAFSPWLIGEGILYPPSMEVGTAHIGLGGIDFVIEGAAPTSNILGLSSSLRRPPLPRK